MVVADGPSDGLPTVYRRSAGGKSAHFASLFQAFQRPFSHRFDGFAAGFSPRFRRNRAGRRRFRAWPPRNRAPACCADERRGRCLTVPPFSPSGGFLTLSAFWSAFVGFGGAEVSVDTLRRPHHVTGHRVPFRWL